MEGSQPTLRGRWKSSKPRSPIYDSSIDAPSHLVVTRRLATTTRAFFTASMHFLGSDLTQLVEKESDLTQSEEKESDLTQSEEKESDLTQSEEKEANRESLSLSHRPATDFSHSYDILVHVDLYLHEEGATLSRWYSITVPADGSQKVDGDDEEVEIKPFWIGYPPQDLSVVVLGSHIYNIGGQQNICKFVPDVYTLQLPSEGEGEPEPEEWLYHSSMITPRLEPHSHVIGGKLFVLNGYDTYNFSYARHNVAAAAEVFDPKINKWEALPDPPCKLSDNFFTAALENPDRILVASCQGSNDRFAMFCTYHVESGRWDLLDSSPRRLHRWCPIRRSFGRAMTVSNTLYWLPSRHFLLAYHLEADVWLLGKLEILGESFRRPDLRKPGNIYVPSPTYPHRPSLVHLENQRFCFLECASDHTLHCIIADIFPNLNEKRLDIKRICVHRYAIDYADETTDVYASFLLRKNALGEADKD